MYGGGKAVGPAAAVGGGTALARTGFPVLGFALLALALMLVGFMLLRAGMRRGS
ncbi:MAG: hypothetical protein ACR2HY_02175 [Acidimicrobiales bacterium]